MPLNSRGSLLFHFHGLKGFPGRGALGYVCAVSQNGYEESLGICREGGGAVTRLIEVKLSPVCETEE